MSLRIPWPAESSARRRHLLYLNKETEGPSAGSGINFSTGMPDPHVREPRNRRQLLIFAAIGLVLLLALPVILTYEDASSPASAPAQTAQNLHTPEAPRQTAGREANLPKTTRTVVQTPNPTSVVTNAPTPSPTPMLLLAQGSHGDQVKAMQERLIKLGYLAAGKADGDFGSGTKEAVIAFQKANGLTDDGKAGERTLTLLFSDQAKAKE